MAKGPAGTERSLTFIPNEGEDHRPFTKGYHNMICAFLGLSVGAKL